MVKSESSNFDNLMQDDLPLVSIVTVVLNGEDVIEETILSVIHQIYPNIEYIFIDGNSKDKTIENILVHKKSINFLISENDKGIYYAMNKGIKFCKGEVIVFVNSGDVLFPKALKYARERIDDAIKIVIKPWS